MALVLELQRDALDRNIQVSDLLRKALVVATKLRLDEFKAWVNDELNGYADKDVPLYRIISGKVVAQNPFYGLEPVVFQDAQTHNMFSIRHERSPIGVLDGLFDQHPDGAPFTVQFTNEKQRALLAGMEFPLACHLQIPRAAIVRILDTVRNTILTWSLKLEEDGIKGEGMSFTSEEQALAKEKVADLRPIIINNMAVGNAEASAIQQGSRDARQTIT